MDPSDLLQPLQELLALPILTMGAFTLTVQDVLLAALVLLATGTLVLMAKRFVRRMFAAESEEEEGAQGVVEPILVWGLWIAGILVAADVVGADMTVARDIVNAELLSISGSPVSLASLLVFLIIAGISWAASRFFRRWAASGLRARAVDSGTVAITNRLIHYGVMAVGLALALDNLGVNLGALLAAGAILGVGLGFAMQEIAQNFVAGLILLVERSIKPGDVLEVEGRVVKVEKMGIRITVARTRDDEEIIIPNSTLSQNTVKNYTLRDSLYRVRVMVGVEYGSDMTQVREVLERAAAGEEWRFRSRDPVVLLREFGDSAVNWDVSVWMSDPWGAPRGSSRLHEALWFALKKADVVIAFPQVDVHFDPPIEQAAEALPRAS